jgi:hypothetical protein
VAIADLMFAEIVLNGAVDIRRFDDDSKFKMEMGGEVGDMLADGLDFGLY